MGIVEIVFRIVVIAASALCFYYGGYRDGKKSSEEEKPPGYPFENLMTGEEHYEASINFYRGHDGGDDVCMLCIVGDHAEGWYKTFYDMSEREREYRDNMKRRKPGQGKGYQPQNGGRPPKPKGGSVFDS